MKENLKSDNYILYIDTADVEATISICKSKEIIKSITWMAGRELSATLSKKYTDIFNESIIKPGDLLGICVFVGPGSFTGLRIGISFANGIAFALNIPIYETKTKKIINLDDPKKIALPFYGSEPIITKPKGLK